jgi:hypothetical protein
MQGARLNPGVALRKMSNVSVFLSAKFDQIIGLKPGLAIGFSDIQADIAQALIKRGVEVWISNHRIVDGILGYVRRLGAMVGAVIARAPDIIIGSWCRKDFRPERVASRIGYELIPAVEIGELHAVKSSIILQHGSAALSDRICIFFGLLDRIVYKPGPFFLHNVIFPDSRCVVSGRNRLSKTGHRPAP